MGVNVIFRIAAVGILVSVLCQVLKHSGREEQAFLTSLAGLRSEEPRRNYSNLKLSRLPSWA